MNSKSISAGNPLIPAPSADPWVIYDGGYYYYCFSEGEEICITKAKDLFDIGTNEAKSVYKAPSEGEFTSEYWAPELHKIDGHWYIYVAADDGDNENHRMIVLKAVTDDVQGQYCFKSKISSPSDKWAIDGTVMEHDEKLYFIWSGWEGDVNGAQNLYIAPMSDPWTISGERVQISNPEYSWEMIGNPMVNEGPEVLKKNDAVYIIYSASGSWTDDYCLGMLTLTGDDVLKRASWTKSREPLFSKRKTAYGPGHCSFTTDPEGKTDWIVYHANEFSGSGWEGRSVRTQPFAWEGDVPIFGEPWHIDREIEMTQNKNGQ